MQSTPSHLGGLAPETINYAIIEPLLQLHDYGLFTTEGQPCTEGGGVDQTTDTSFTGEKLTSWEERRQLAYLQFMIPQQRRRTATKKQIRSFFDALFKVNMIEAIVSWSAYSAGDHEEFADINIRYAHETSPLPSGLQRRGTNQYRSAPSKSEVVETKWRETSGDPELLVQGWSELEEFPIEMLEMYPVIVHVSCPVINYSQYKC